MALALFSSSLRAVNLHVLKITLSCRLVGPGALRTERQAHKAWDMQDPVYVVMVVP